MEASSSVELFVYDLSRGLAKQFSAQLVGTHFEGIWHTGIVVYGREYFYGGGLQAMNPGQTPFGVPAQRIPLGSTSIPKDIFEEFLQTMIERFNVNNYDLFHNNCNHFTEEASLFLTGNSIPVFIRTLPTDFLSTPFGAMLKPVIDSFYGRAANPLPTAAVLPPAPAEPKQQPPHSHPAPVTGAATVKHPHTALSLPNIGYSQLVLFDKGEPTTIYEKLNSFLGALPVEKKLSIEESQSFSAFAAVLVGKDRTAPIPATALAVLERVLSVLAPEQYFPVLDLLRFAVLWPAFNTAITTPADNIVSRLMQRHLSTHIQNPPRSVVLLGLRLLSNLFAHPAGAHYLVAPAVVPLLVDAVVLGLNSTDASTRLSAATLAYNTSLYLICNESEALAQLVSAIVALLNEATLKPEDEASFLLLVALGHFMYCNNTAVELVKVLDLGLGRFVSSPLAKVQAAAQDVHRMLT